MPANTMLVPETEHVIESGFKNMDMPTSLPLTPFTLQQLDDRISGPNKYLAGNTALLGAIHNHLLRFARHGGPDLCHLRGVSASIRRLSNGTLTVPSIILPKTWKSTQVSLLAIRHKQMRAMGLRRGYHHTTWDLKATF